MKDNCERCGDGLPNVYDHAHLDRCHHCRTTLCESCMDDGCCGKTPAASHAQWLGWIGRDVPPVDARATVDEGTTA